MNIVTVILSSTVATMATDLGQLNFKPHHGQTCIKLRSISARIINTVKACNNLITTVKHTLKHKIEPRRCRRRRVIQILF